jgi:hypothetical protein
MSEQALVKPEERANAMQGLRARSLARQRG